MNFKRNNKEFYNFYYFDLFFVYSRFSSWYFILAEGNIVVDFCDTITIVCMFFLLCQANIESHKVNATIFEFEEDIELNWNE